MLRLPNTSAPELIHFTQQTEITQQDHKKLSNDLCYIKQIMHVMLLVFFAIHR
jgi:hypothetical protein